MNDDHETTIMDTELVKHPKRSEIAAVLLEPLAQSGPMVQAITIRLISDQGNKEVIDDYVLTPEQARIVMEDIHTSLVAHTGANS